MSGHFEKFKISQTVAGYVITYENKPTGAQITLSIPLSGIFESDANRQITKDEVKDIGEQVAVILDDSLV